MLRSKQKCNHAVVQLKLCFQHVTIAQTKFDRAQQSAVEMIMYVGHVYVHCLVRSQDG